MEKKKRRIDRSLHKKNVFWMSSAKQFPQLRMFIGECLDPRSTDFGD